MKKYCSTASNGRKKKLNKSIIEKYSLLRRSISQSNAYLLTTAGPDGTKAADIDRLIYDLRFNISLMEEIKENLEREYGCAENDKDKKIDNIIKFAR